MIFIIEVLRHICCLYNHLQSQSLFDLYRFARRRSENLTQSSFRLRSLLQFLQLSQTWISVFTALWLKSGCSLRNNQLLRIHLLNKVDFVGSQLGQRIPTKKLLRQLSLHETQELQKSDRRTILFSLLEQTDYNLELFRSQFTLVKTKPIWNIWYPIVVVCEIIECESVDLVHAAENTQFYLALGESLLHLFGKSKNLYILSVIHQQIFNFNWFLLHTFRFTFNPPNDFYVKRSDIHLPLNSTKIKLYDQLIELPSTCF